MISQDTDGNRCKRKSLLHMRIDAPQPLDMSDQEVAATVGERKREEKHPGFDLESTIAGHPSFPRGFGGHGAFRAFAHLQRNVAYSNGLFQRR